MVKANSASGIHDDADPRRASLFFLRDAADDERARFFLWAPVCLGVGIAAYFALPVEPSLTIAAVPLVFAVIARAMTSRGTLLSIAVTGLCLTAAGFGLAKLRVEKVRAPVLQKALNNAQISGTVISVEPRAPRGARLTIRVAELAGLPPERRPVIVRVRTMSAASTDIRPGVRIRITAKLAPPAKPALPGGFDYARTAWFERLGGVGYSYATPVIEAEDERANLSSRFWCGVEKLRLVMDTRIRAALPGETGGIASALITGERGGISTATNDAYRSSGLFHILSISGLHMVIMAGAVFFLVRTILAAVPAIALRFPIKKWAAVAGIAGALAYLAISGGAFATVRSALMIVVIFGAVLLDRPALALRNVALSAFVILMLYPESLFDAGFQMSFAAVTGLVATYEEVRRRMGRRSEPHPFLRVVMFFGGIVFSTLIASAAVAPLAAYHFHQSQQYAVLANLAAIPICNLLVMPAALAVILLMPFGLEALALWPMGKGIEAMSWCANIVAKLPGAVGHIPAFPELAFALMMLGGLWLALWQTRLRLLGLGMIAGGLALAPFMPRPDLLIARNGELVALRGADGRLSALPARQAKFELERWLESDGDARKSPEVSNARAFTCDGAGCIAHVKGLTVAVPKSGAALADDCALAGLVILTEPRPKGCPVTTKSVDVFDVWRNGAHAIYVERDDETSAPRLRVDTVAAHRGDRPWSPIIAPHEPRLPKPRISKNGTATEPGTAANGETEKQQPEGDAAPKDYSKSAATKPDVPAAQIGRPELEDDDADLSASPDPDQ